MVPFLEHCVQLTDSGGLPRTSRPRVAHALAQGEAHEWEEAYTEPVALRELGLRRSAARALGGAKAAAQLYSLQHPAEEALPRPALLRRSLSQSVRSFRRRPALC